MAIFEFDPNYKDGFKWRRMLCRDCGIETLHTTPFIGRPFQCVANHGGKTLCNGCGAFVGVVAKVIVDAEGRHGCYCELCASPNSPEKEEKLEERSRQVREVAQRPFDLDDPESFARAVGASSYGGRK